jgi:hypothetical protein
MSVGTAGGRFTALTVIIDYQWLINNWNKYPFLGAGIVET